MDPLIVDVVYFYPKENAETHKAMKYEVINNENPTTTIVRRGQPFNGVIMFNRTYDENNDIVQLVFTIGDKPQMDTQGSMFLRQDAIPDNHTWTAKLLNVQENTLSFEVSTPVTLPVGLWALRIITKLKNSPVREVYKFNEDIYILFNPWNHDDQTYMEDTNLLEEYVLNDVGKVWIGPIKTTKGKPWLYGQFDEVVLPACMLMLDKANLLLKHRGDPIKVTRAISRIVNSNDDDGVLVGRWDGQYEDGTSPSEWTGSVDILQQFLETQQSVPYGQCWVFSSVVTTVCRALGIPSRVVSNLVSAHDANSTLTVDMYYTETMEELDSDPNNPGNASDSVWNYHVWNDVWMARPDLPAGFGGWQAIDGTPQETSEGVYQCGPAPLKAIKQGIIGVGYDVEFMLASVNADLVRWREDPESETGYSVVETNNYHIGRKVLTKKPFVFDPVGDEDREDITSQYKYQEGTDSERLALMNGVRFSERAKRYYSVVSKLQNDVNFRLREIDTIFIGQNFKIVVDVKNTSNEGRTIKASLSATSIFYKGIKSDTVKKVQGKIFVGPQKRFGGWQAIDGTPQETSEGVYQCGPAPLKAIKQGIIGVGYDVEFMLASVNADLVRWREDPESETGYSVVETNNYHIGRKVLTKKPFVFDPVGDEDREDITSQYKYQEGTDSERLALMNGVRFSERAKRYYSVVSKLQNDVNFRLREIDTIFIGQNFKIVVDVKNTSNEGRTIKASLSATSIFYKGIKSDTVKKVQGKIFVGPQKQEQISILVKADDYLPKLVEYCNMKISSMAIVEETKQSWADDDDFQILKPNIHIKFNEDLVVDQATSVVLSFMNPLERTLTLCEFRMTSPGIAGRVRSLPVADAAPRGLINAELSIQPNKLGTISLIATFKSVELTDIHGAATVEVFEG